LTREYQCLNENNISQYVLAKHLLNHFDDYELVHVKRYQNMRANELAQKTSGYKISKELANHIITGKDIVFN